MKAFLAAITVCLALFPSKGWAEDRPTQDTCLFGTRCGGGAAPAPVRMPEQKDYTAQLMAINAQLSEIRSEQKVQTELLRRMAYDQGALGNVGPGIAPLDPRLYPAIPNAPVDPRQYPAVPNAPARPQDYAPKPNAPTNPNLTPIGNAKARMPYQTAIYRGPAR